MTTTERDPKVQILGEHSRDMESTNVLHWSTTDALPRIGLTRGAQMGEFGRREFIAGVGLAVAQVRQALAAQNPRTRLILLGTGGGPRPRTASSAAAQVIVSNGIAYVIDCGDGVARQLVSAGIPLATLRHIFVTHQHSDHNADYGNLMWLAWTAGLRTRVDTWGPPPLERMTRLFFEMNQYDIDMRIANEGRVPLVPLVSVHELRAGGAVMSDEHRCCPTSCRRTTPKCDRTWRSTWSPTGERRALMPHGRGSVENRP